MRGQLQIACAALLVLSSAFIACGGDDDDDGKSAEDGGTAGKKASQAGSKASAGKSGSGGAKAGASGSKGEAGAAGKAAAGSGGSNGSDSEDDLTCASAKTGSDGELHDAAAAAILPTSGNLGCAFSSCHDKSSHKAGLALTESPKDLKMQLVGKAACEVKDYPLVDTSGGDDALKKSWLWQKLAAPADSDGQLKENADWGDPVTSCGQEMGFGLRMPRSQSDMLLSPAKLRAVRDWICAGAPGPE